MMRLRAMIVDDHPVVADGLARVFELDGRIEVIGRAGTLAEAEVLLRRQTPDVVLLDMRLPDSANRDVIRVVRSATSTSRIVVFTAGNGTSVEEARRHGADALLNKHDASDKVVQTILTLCRLTQPAADRKDPLTARELDVARLAAEGLTRTEIAGRLFISQNTVKTHLAHVFRKLGFRNRVDLVRRWRAGHSETHFQSPKANRPNG